MSAIPNFHKLSLKEKLKILEKECSLNKEDLNLIYQYQTLLDFLDVENNIGPFKIATNFLVNNKDFFVPMETEEPSVVAAASKGAKLVREGGGFFGKYLKNIMVGQIQLVNVKEFQKAKERILKNREKIIKLANSTNPILIKLSGGAKDLKIKRVGKFLVVYLKVDPKDAQGANIINTMLERISSFLEKLSGGRAILRIISNFSPERVVKVSCKIPIEKLKISKFSPQEIAERIILAYELAKKDVFRAVTHNKGIMNGIDAVALSTGNDFRVIESAIHSFASRDGKYKPVSSWTIKDNFLKGEIKIPLPIATVGGATVTKKARLALKILNVKDAKELGVVAASVGLANNFSALLALSTEGIQKGHMKLHKEFLKKVKKT
jgi:hydroxymethylglutaryl-CoA reductase